MGWVTIPIPRAEKVFVGDLIQLCFRNSLLWEWKAQICVDLNWRFAWLDALGERGPLRKTSHAVTWRLRPILLEVTLVSGLDPTVDFNSRTCGENCDTAVMNNQPNLRV